MRPEESFLSQPIRSLQTMLRVLAEQDNNYLTVIPDGIYGPETMHSVAKLQSRHGLYPTGVTDQETWDTLYREYEKALTEVDEAQPLDIVLEPNQVIRKGQRHPNIYLLQAILAVLAQVYESIGTPSHTGILDNPTADALASFQALSGLPMTGDLDKHTWKQLALHYPMAASRCERG